MRFVVPFLGLLLAASIAQAESRLIAVMPFEDGRVKVEAKYHAQLEKIVAEASAPVLQKTKYRFVTPTILDGVITAKADKQTSCGTACIERVVTTLRLDLYLTGTMSKMGQDYVAFIRVMDAETSTSLAAVQLRSATVEGLGEEFRTKVTPLFERAIPDELYAYNAADAAKDLLAQHMLECTNGNAESCNDAGYAYLYGEGAEKDEKVGAEYYEMSCKADNANGCTFFAWVLEGGLGGYEKNEKKAAATYERGCRNGEGNAYACTLLGNMLAEGRGGQRDRARATKFFKKGCDAGDGEGCMNLGRAYQTGAGVTRDADKARDLIDQACSLGYDEACDDTDD